MSQPHVHRLANGLRVVHANHPGALAGLYLWFDAGTAWENDTERGAAHLLEHMVFKGSEQFGIGEGAAVIEALGGDLNAYTTWDQTVFHATVMAHGWRQALAVLADMAWESSLDPDELEREKSVVVEEIRGYASDPESVVEDIMTARLYPDSPYGSPVLGTEDSVRGMSRDTLHAFWRKHYTAGRCILGIAGPMSLEDVLAAASELEPPDTQPVDEPVAPAVATSALHTVDGGFDTPVVSLAFRTPGDGHADNAALEVLASTLGSGRAAILPSWLRFDEGWVADVWTSSYTRRTAGSFEVGFIPRDEGGPAALAAILDLFAAPHTLSPTAIARGRNNLLTDLLFSSESVESRAHDLTWFTGRDGSPDAQHAWRQAIADVTAEDVRRVAQRWLVDPVVVALGNTHLTAIPEPSRRSTQVARTVRASPEDAALDLGRISSVYLCWPGGLQAETLETRQLTDAWAALLTTGAGALTNLALASALDEVGGSLRAIAGRSSLGVQLTAPAMNLDRAIDVLRDVLVTPRFEASEWSRIREEALMDLDLMDDRPEEILARRVWALAWPGHPWGVARTRTHLRAIHPDAVRHFHEEWVTQSPVVGLAGPVPEGCLDRLLVGLPATPPVFAVPAVPPLPTGHFESVAGGEQALVVATTRVPSIHHAHTAALRVAVAWMSAQSGPLFLDLRERQSLAYSVWARMAEAPSAGLLTIGLATDPERRGAARRALLEVIERLREAGPTEDDLRKTTAMLLGQLASANQSAAGRAVRLALSGYYGLETGTHAAERDLVAVTTGQVRRALQALPPFFTVTVRPR